MITPTSLLRMCLVLLGLTAVILLGGCRTKTTSFAPKTTPPPVHHSVPPSDIRKTKTEAVKVVTQYVLSLEDQDFAGAYELLSRDSRNTHTFSYFEQQGKQGMPSFDLKTAAATVTDNNVVVNVQQLEDPTTHDFNLVREDGGLKIVYQGGLPGSP